MKKILYLGFPGCEEEKDRRVAIELDKEQPFAIGENGELIFIKNGMYPIINRDLTSVRKFSIVDVEIRLGSEELQGFYITSENCEHIARVMGFSDDCHKDGLEMLTHQENKINTPKFYQLFPDGCKTIAQC